MFGSKGVHWWGSSVVFGVRSGPFLTCLRTRSQRASEKAFDCLWHATCTIDEKAMTDVNTTFMIADDFRTALGKRFGICMAMDLDW